jgi:cytochrome c oxidase subunit IV
MKIILIISVLMAFFWADIAALIAYAVLVSPGTIAVVFVATFGIVFLTILFGMSLCCAAGQADDKNFILIE